MLKYIVVFLLLAVPVFDMAQNIPISSNQIDGIVSGKPIIPDTVFFIGGKIDNKYYKQPRLVAPLNGNRYILHYNVSYPQMYSILFASDRNFRPWRNGDYFIDPSTTNISTKYNDEECNEIQGATFAEYSAKFIPYFTGKPYDCTSNYLAQMFNSRETKTDSILFNYVTENPNSYVALWKLIERFSSQGQSALRQKTLALFSRKMKKTEIWKTLHKDFMQSKLKENEKFPSVSLKDIDLKPTKLLLTTGVNYTLIDYWFARCRPCLDTIPELKRLYGEFSRKELSIISISVDETKNVPIWQARVKEHGLIWPQYLEENNFRNNELGIKMFPTFLLLNKNGEVIWRDFDLHELETFLKAHFKMEQF